MPKQRSDHSMFIDDSMWSFKTGHSVYVDVVKSRFRDGCRWMDAGGGRQLLPDLYDGEREMVRRSNLVVACDLARESLSRHVSVPDRVCCDLSRIPLPAHSFDLITCTMVVEHLNEPSDVFDELARLLDKGGHLVIHTVNLWGYPTLAAIAAKLIPYSIRQSVIAKVTKRSTQDIFPTYYRCNTARQLRSALASVGLTVQGVRYLASGRLFRRPRLVGLLESVAIGVTRLPMFGQFQSQLLATAIKP